jgi:hypothetical protein
MFPPDHLEPPACAIDSACERRAAEIDVMQARICDCQRNVSDTRRRFDRPSTGSGQAVFESCAISSADK